MQDPKQDLDPDLIPTEKQDPKKDLDPDLKPTEKQDPDPKKIIPDLQH